MYLLILIPRAGCSRPALLAFTAISGTLQMCIVPSQLPQPGNFMETLVNLREKEQFALHGSRA